MKVFTLVCWMRRTTRVQRFMGMPVPDDALSGHHKNIESGREKSLALTLRTRSTLLNR